MTEKKIGVVGGKGFCLGFKLAGIQRQFIVKDEEYREKMLELNERDDFGVIITDGDQFSTLPFETRQKLKTSVSPIFVSLSEDGAGETLRKKIKESVGVDLLR